MTHSLHRAMTKRRDSRCRGAGFVAAALALAILGGTSPAKADVVPTPRRLYDLPRSTCIDDAAPSRYLPDNSRTGVLIDSPSMYMSFYDTSEDSEQTVWWIPSVFWWNGTGWTFLKWGEWHYGTAQGSAAELSCSVTLTGGSNCSSVYQPQETTGWQPAGFSLTPGHYYKAAIYYYWPATIDVDHGTTVQVGSKSAYRWVAGDPYCHLTGNGTGVTVIVPPIH